MRHEIQMKILIFTFTSKMRNLTNRAAHREWIIQMISPMEIMTALWMQP